MKPDTEPNVVQLPAPERLTPQEVQGIIDTLNSAPLANMAHAQAVAQLVQKFARLHHEERPPCS